MKINIRLINELATLPSRGSELAAGYDLYAALPEPVEIGPGHTEKIPTGISLEIPEGYAGFVYARSGLASKQGLAPANKVGVVDADYRGEIFVFLHNHGISSRTVEQGERIAQLIVAPFMELEFNEVNELSETQRGEGGFGSTGTR